MSGINTGFEEDREPTFSTPDGSPQWQIKVMDWAGKFRKTCKLKAGLNGQFCIWQGGPCCYNLCPARIFEEVRISEFPEFPPTPDPPKLRARVAEAEKKIDALTLNQQEVFTQICNELKELKESMIKKES